MSVLVNEITSVICLGITGSQGASHTEQKTVHRAKLVGSVTDIRRSSGEILQAAREKSDALCL
jgi:succinyl-CoA synthetase alpha subunit